jgi:hypothetical protein
MSFGGINAFICSLSVASGALFRNGRSASMMKNTCMLFSSSSWRSTIVNLDSSASENVPPFPSSKSLQNSLTPFSLSRSITPRYFPAN